MPATARMILMVDPAEKARWTAEAKKAGISTAEFVRRGAAVYDGEMTPEEMALLGEMTGEANAAIDRMVARLDGMIARLDDLNDPAHERRTRTRVMADLEANPPVLDFSVFAGSRAAA